MNLPHRHGKEKEELKTHLLRAVVPLCGIVCLVLLACPSPSLAEDTRQNRSPQEVAEQLAKVYGHKLDQVAYIPALPLVAKLRLSELTAEAAHREEVNRIVAPFRSGEHSPIPQSGSEQAGHLNRHAARRLRQLTICFSAPDLYFAAILSSGSGLIFDAMPAQPNCS